MEDRAMNATVERVRAVLRLLGDDEITPTGRRMIEKVLDAEESMEAEGGYTAYPAGHEGAMRDYNRRMERRNAQD